MDSNVESSCGATLGVATNAMQLDINPEWTDFMYYTPGRDPADPSPAAVLPDQQASVYRYYSVFGRDFTAVYAR